MQKQIDTLNRNFTKLCGEPLVVKRGRGQDVLFTPTGQAVVEMAMTSFAGWFTGIHESRRRLGVTLAVGATEFTVRLLAEAHEQLADEFARREARWCC